MTRNHRAIMCLARGARAANQLGLPDLARELIFAAIKRLPPCDSGRLPEGEDSRSEAECAASQSGGATSAASPTLKPPNHPSNREAT